MAFGGIIRQETAPFSNPYGIGGDASTIWHCDLATVDVYELLVLDFSVDRFADAPDTSPRGIGGDASIIWLCDADVDDIYELLTADFSVDRFANSPNANPYGVGGDTAAIWHCDNAVDDVYELLVADFSVDRNANSPAALPYGMGGDASVIWHSDIGTDDVYELSLSDFSVDRNANSPGGSPRGTGGSASTIWHCDSVAHYIYELDTDPPISAPTVTTQAVDNIAAATATGHVTITDVGGENAHTRGVCWNTGGTPTTGDDKSEDNGGGSYSTGAFPKGMTGLTPDQLYYVRGYAINSAGTSYGNQVSFTTLSAGQGNKSANMAAKLVTAGVI